MKKTFKISEQNPFPEESYLSTIHVNAFQASTRLGKNLEQVQLEKLCKLLKDKQFITTSRNSSDLAKLYIRAGKKEKALEIQKEE